MKRFKNILYVSREESEDAYQAKRISNLARLNEAKVTICGVSTSQYPFDLSSFLPSLIKKIEQIAKEDFSHRIERFVSDAGWRDLNLSVDTSPYRDFVDIIKLVLHNKHDLVVLTGSNNQGVDQFAMRLIRKCPCPVWVIRQNHNKDFRCILGAVDLQDNTIESFELNRKIVEITHSLAQRENGEAHYFHSWRLEFESMMRGPRLNVKPEELSEIKETIRKEREAAFSDLIERCGVFPEPDNIHLVEGHTAESIERMKERLNIDVLVMGSVGRTGIPGFILGNRAEKILNQIDCTVLTVKPDGFVTPVSI